ncbi:uncharacterized protein BO97DRAFT_210257 [Aspergillus homomorphus CBS 101889]|uniref:Uncharacterized protein n=1 Tax=Aspergillus homomorphus (strain CBS 101889) TaxID=1450537 RepID=A0A395I6J1_ASPHC|nr:hypothetical protein BO97DRAFT_210257 [Aspergillus homomorphus CBS 101889]RAL15379.1 hypothetical protein BO97DRAFT_210257 [Aspergillus homomorphus CBS 101889]
MNDDLAESAQQALDVTLAASSTIREAIARTLPIASTQLLSLQVPAIILDPDDYHWDKSKASMPLKTRIAEAKLVDSMVPVSKLSIGQCGKSVARSYMAALDRLVPVTAAGSNMHATNSTQALDLQFQAARDRYRGAMRYLESADERAQAQSKISTYIAKQQAWAQAVQQYSEDQARQRVIIEEHETRADKQQERYLEWLKENTSKSKANVQARYMDWVVHGFKHEAEFNFAIVDSSSALKRVEMSKEALRNWTVVDGDGVSEYSGVVLDPSGWADLLQQKMEQSKMGASPPWMHISAKVSKSSFESVEVGQEMVSTFASLGLLDGSKEAMSFILSLEVQVSMDCMLVEISRPWLHAELFADPELDAVDGLPLSPGPEKLHQYVQENKTIPAQYAKFPSYNTAFVVACNIELEFSGDTSALESLLDSSDIELSPSLSYGPFVIPRSSKRSKVSTESTTTGLRVSLQRPQIVGWVQELLPELPNPKDAANKLSKST